MALPAGAPIQARFDLGNSSTARKRISVLLIEADFSDISVCTFWVPPGEPMATYRMRTHTTKPWTNAAIYFYAATEGSDNGFNLVDNVSVQFDPTQPDDVTECVDPTAPEPSGGPDGPELLVNGDFGTGTTQGWSMFGTLTSQVDGGVVEFARETGARVIGYCFTAPTREAVGRNRGREGAARVPDVAIFTTAKRMVAPSRDEGFDELYAVAIGEEGSFVVQPI
jgi:hypothetical protein